MTSSIASAILAVMIFLVMLGVGLALAPADLSRALRARRALLTALACQLLVMPAICFLLTLALGLARPVAIGMMLLAASPGGTTAAIFSYLARGDVALNVALTGINSVLAVFTLPVVVDMSIRYFDYSSSARVGISPGRFAELFLILLIPIVLGMYVRSRRSSLTQRMTGPTKALSGLLLVSTGAAAIALEHNSVSELLGLTGIAASLFCLIAFVLGYGASRIQRLPKEQATAIALEIGVHNSSLAVAIALSPRLLGDPEIAIPAIIYAMVAVPISGIFCYCGTRVRKGQLLGIVKGGLSRYAGPHF